MTTRHRQPTVLLPKGWTGHVRSALLHAISLATIALSVARSRAATSRAKRHRLQAELDQTHTEIALPNEELRIKDGRLSRLPSRRRPHYSPIQRMRILQLKAARGWSCEQAARGFLIDEQTLRSWFRRVDEDGESALIQISEPVKKFPDFVRYLVRQLQALLPTMGKVRIALVGFAVFSRRPTSEHLQRSLDLPVRRVGHAPKYVITDKGRQFWCDSFRQWCRRRAICPRFGAVGKYGSIAIVERFIRSMKNECTRHILVPLQLDAMRRELAHYAVWYNHHRPSEALGGRTPWESYANLRPANVKPRLEPRANWLARSSCASPQTPIRGTRATNLSLAVSYVEGRRHLPVIELRRAA